MPGELTGAIPVVLADAAMDDLADRIAARLRASQSGDDQRDTSPWLTAKEAASYLKLGLSEVQRLAAAGLIPHEQDGGRNGRLFFHRDDLDQWRRNGGRNRA